MNPMGLDVLVERIPQLLPRLQNEEQTKASLITPFIQMLGYDVFDPHVVQREFKADPSDGRDAVDYAVLRGDKPIILVEAKHHAVNLSDANMRQLRRYFSAVPECRIGMLTNGLEYRVFTDTGAPNYMDEHPIVSWNMLALSDDMRERIEMFRREAFNEKRIVAGCAVTRTKKRFAGITGRVKSALTRNESVPVEQAKREVTPKNDSDAGAGWYVDDNGKTRRTQFRFDHCGIPVGATITFKDAPSLSVIVAADEDMRLVEYHGEQLTLGNAGKRIRQAREEQVTGKNTGVFAWCYDGETLADRRIRMEQEGTYGV